MPVGIRISEHVQGLAELDKFLEGLPVEMQRKMLYSALMTGAKPIMDEAALNVARTFGMSARYTGTLAHGITRGRTKKTGLAARVLVKLKNSRSGAMTFRGAMGQPITKEHGLDPFYGRFLEKGTKKMQKREWLAPAGRSKQGASSRLFQVALEKKVQAWCKAHGVKYEPGA